MTWLFDPNTPVYLQIIEHIESEIISGVYQLGDKLPSVRDLAKEASVNPNTMQKALVELERKGLIITERTSGRHITTNESIIKKIKKEQAYKIVEEFINRMKKLGYTYDEIKSEILEYNDK